jgi:hypothetical protein
MGETYGEANAPDKEQGQKRINDKDAPGKSLKSAEIQDRQNDDR